MSEEKLVPKLRFSGFDDKWKSVKLNETGEIVTGATPPTKNKDNFTNFGYIWVTPGDIDSKKIVSKTERNLSEKGLEKGRKIESNSILVTCIGATIGKICMIKETGSCNQQLNAITPNEYFFPDFIYYTIQKTAKNLLLIAGNTATPILNKKSFGNLSYNFPSFDEQKKIALFIDKIDRKIELLEKKYETYQNFKKYLMQQIFAQKLRFAEFDYNWVEYSLNDIGKIITGTTPSTKNKNNFSDNGYLWVTPGDISNKRIVTSTERNLSKEGLNNGRELPQNSILVTCIGATIGKICMIKEVGSCNQQLNAIIPNKQFDPDFIYYIIQYNAERLKLIAGNTATPILNKKSFGNIKLEFPKLIEQRKISKLLTSMDDAIDNIESGINNMQYFKNGLLQQMFI